MGHVLLHGDGAFCVGHVLLHTGSEGAFFGGHEFLRGGWDGALSLVMFRGTCDDGEAGHSHSNHLRDLRVKSSASQLNKPYNRHNFPPHSSRAAAGSPVHKILS